MSLLLFLSAALLLGCGADQKVVQDLESCKKELSSSKYRLESLREQQREVSRPEGGDSPNASDSAAWQAAYRQMSEDMKQRLNDVPHEMFIQNGALVLSFTMESIFSPGKVTVSVAGRTVVEKMSAAIAQLEGRDVIVACRSFDIRVASKTPFVISNRTLSLKRASVIIGDLEKGGIDPQSLIAAAFGDVSSDENVEEEGSIEFHILPTIEELPVFSGLLDI